MKDIEQAIAFAMNAHGTQKRKDADIPYIVHPITVALILARAGFDDEVLMSAILHDVLEDTQVSFEELSAVFGKAVAENVAAVSHTTALSWKEKKEAYIAQVRVSSHIVKAIATADKIANAESLQRAHSKEGEAVWRHFNASREEKIWFEETMLAMLQETWNHPLVATYAKHVDVLRTLV